MRKTVFANRFAVPALLVVVALGATTPARASQLFAFNYSLPGAGATPMPISASGFFATTDLVGTSYEITGAWGTWNGTAITGILAPGTFGANNNLLYTSDPFLDINGVSFTVDGPGDDGAGNVNVYYDGTGYSENSDDVGNGPAFSVTPVAPSPVYFRFSYAIPGFGPTPMDVSASGNLTAFQSDADTYLVSSIEGTWNGVSILGLLPVGTFGGNDNLVFGTAPHLTWNGLGFAVNGVGDDDAGNVNVFYIGDYTELSDNVDFTSEFNLVQTPEPGSVTLLLTGIPFALYLVRRRRMNT